MTTTDLCECKLRQWAREAHTFRWSPPLGGWVLTTIPNRRYKSRSFLGYKIAQGPPYTWADCPWCGRELPLGTEKDI